MKIVAARCADVPAEEWEKLQEIAWAEFNQYPLVRETHWAQPEWCYRGFVDQKLVVFYNLVLRSVRIDGTAVRVAGLNNMITLAAHRGGGHASRLLRETQANWREKFDVEGGLLLCADTLVPFYAKRGWVRTDAQVMYDQPSGKKSWAANCMLLDTQQQFPDLRQIDLCGLPW
jgi:hypothetical protein